MKFRWIKTNSLIKRFFTNYVWDVPNSDRKVFLTFDDGPTPTITEWTLDQLKSYKAKATFFCIGDNVKKFPNVFQKVIDHGHSIGNHTFNHLNGWKTSTKEYISNTKLYQTEHYLLTTECCNLFRPPYGKIKPSQSKELRKLGYKIIMWDVISYDFDTSLTPEKCLNNVLKNIESGSIVVFHDSQKAFKNLEFVLPRTLDYLNKKGFICDKL